MPVYKVTDPTTGKTMRLTGDSPPTEAELEDIFKQVRGPDVSAAPAGGDALYDNLKTLLMDPAIGAMKGAAHSAVGLGKAVTAIPGVSSGIDAIYRLAGMGDVNTAQAFANRPATESALGLDAQGNAQKLGRFLEQMGEFMVPGGVAEQTAAKVGAGLVPRMVAQGAAASGVTAAQGGNPVSAGVVGAAVPVVGKALSGAGQLLESKAVPLVRAAIKPTVTEMKRQAGASLTGLEGQANRLARFIIDNRLTSPDKAQAIIDGAEQELQGAIASAGNPVTDAPQRAERYLDAIKRSASRQGLGSDDVAIIEKKTEELLMDSPYSAGSLAARGGQPLRTDVTASEALQTARQTSKWSTRKAYGEMKGAAMESDKAVERASRDAVKAAVPDAQPILEKQGQAITARKVLDRKAFREGNRDAVSLPAHVMAAGEIASGRVPIMAFAANWLRNNQMKAGIWADQLGTALARNDVQTVTAIMGRLGVGAEAQTTP